MKLVYLIFVMTWSWTTTPPKKQQQQQKETKKQNRTKNKQTYNVMSMDREVLIKAKHGC